MNNTAMLLEMRKNKTSHILHLLLTILTAGLWVFVWLICAILNTMQNNRIDDQINQIIVNERRAIDKASHTT